MLVMNAMCGYPKDRAALQGQCATYGNEIFQPFRGCVPAMCKQAVICHTDTHINRQEVQYSGNDEIRPTKEEQGRKRASMEKRHKGNRNPVDLAVPVRW